MWHYFVVHDGNLFVACAHNILWFTLNKSRRQLELFLESEMYSKAISYFYVSDFSHWTVYNEKLII